LPRSGPPGHHTGSLLCPSTNQQRQNCDDGGGGLSLFASELLRQPEYFITRDEVKGLIHKVANNLINIKDETGEFLLRLDDGRVIDTKGWAGWEWTHGVGLYGIYKYINDQGELTQVSFGTAMGNDLDFYREIALTSMPYGQAMAILCLSEYLRVYI
jgi:hypothetical protein